MRNLGVRRLRVDHQAGEGIGLLRVRGPPPQRRRLSGPPRLSVPRARGPRRAALGLSVLGVIGHEVQAT